MIAYRRLKASDVPAMIGLWKSSGLPIRGKGRESPTRLRAEVKKFPRNFIGAVDGKRLVAVVIVTSDGRKGWINRLAVHPAYRHEGVALELISRAEKELKARGIGIVSALIEKGNEASSALFDKAGYELREDILYVRKEFAKGV